MTLVRKVSILSPTRTPKGRPGRKPRQQRPAPNRIREWRDARGMSRKKLAGILNCHEQTVRKLEDGTISFDEHWHEPIAKALGVSKSQLLRDDYSQPAGRPVKLVPVIEWVSAGRPMAVLEQNIPEDAPRVATDYESETLLATKVCGNSMNNVAPDGETIIYDYSDRELVDKGCYLFLVNGDLSFKRYRANPPRFEPDSTEKGHETFFPQGPVEIVGRVIQVTRRLK